MKVHVITDAPRTVASARFRAWDLVEAWNSPDATCGPLSDPRIQTADVVILTRLIGQPTTFQTTAPIVIWDLTDPIWCYMGDTAFRTLAERITHLTVSSHGLRQALRDEFQMDATVIEDRLPFQPMQRVHEDVPVPTLIWFGYSFNRYPAFAGVSPLLARLRKNGIVFRLQIVDDAPQLPLYEADRYGLAAITDYVPWTAGAMHERLCAADVSLLPSFPGWVGTVKSTNRLLTAAWAGLPVSDGTDYRALETWLTDVNARRKEGAVMRAMAEKYGDIRRSVEDWQRLLTSMQVAV